MNTAYKYYWLPLLLLVAACHSIPAPSGVKVGKPYSVDGKTYYPEYDPTYDKIGMASWYGPGFHGKYTASGEVYNQNDLTAAHPTLPMPSLVRVTNLANGKSLIVRINDRGPFKSNRIIDLSKKAAHDIGISSTAEVRVQFLKKETEEYVASLQDSGKKLDMLAYNAEATHKRDVSIIHSTEPSDQLVEASVSNSHTGQTVNKAAPVISVDSNNLVVPPTVQKRPPQARTDSLSAKANSLATFYIQAGSFASEENAQKLSSKLNPIANVDVGKVAMNEKTWWRVRLGPFASREEASDALARVHGVGLPDARIVHE